jgi:hypothetical protein
MTDYLPRWAAWMFVAAQLINLTAIIRALVF